METVIFTCGVAAIYVANVLIMYSLAWFLTEVIALPWKVKPFTCRECMAFWLTFLVGVVLAFVLTPYVPGIDRPEARTFLRLGLSGVSVLLGLINFLYIKSKFQINE